MVNWFSDTTVFITYFSKFQHPRYIVLCHLIFNTSKKSIKEIFNLLFELQFHQFKVINTIKKELQR